MSTHCSCAGRCGEGIVEEIDLDEETAMTMITHPDTSAAEPKALSIYEAIGGRAAIKAAVDGLFERVRADAELGRFFPAGGGGLRRRAVVALLRERPGGP